MDGFKEDLLGGYWRRLRSRWSQSTGTRRSVAFLLVRSPTKKKLQDKYMAESCSCPNDCQLCCCLQLRVPHSITACQSTNKVHVNICHALPRQMTYSLKYTKTVIPRLPQSSRKVKTFRIQRHGWFLRSANCIIVMLLVPTSGSRQAGKSSRELVSSKYHLPVAPVHDFTNFASANQRSPSKLIVHRTTCSCSPPRSE